MGEGGTGDDILKITLEVFDSILSTSVIVCNCTSVNKPADWRLNVLLIFLLSTVTCKWLPILSGNLSKPFSTLTIDGSHSKNLAAILVAKNWLYFQFRELYTLIYL